MQYIAFFRGPPDSQLFNYAFHSLQILVNSQYSKYQTHRNFHPDMHQPKLSRTKLQVSCTLMFCSTSTQRKHSALSLIRVTENSRGEHLDLLMQATVHQIKCPTSCGVTTSRK